MKRSSILFTITAIMLFSIPFLVGRSFRVAQLPNGNQIDCAMCHVSQFGGGPKNAFGQEVEANFLTAPGSAGQVVWNAQLAALDSDGDGFTNGEELQDPDGTWTAGSPAPGDPTLVTNPGDPDDKPNPTSVHNLHSPLYFELHNNYPNPFNPSTNISFSLTEGANVRVDIYNSIGALVSSLANEYYNPGNHSLKWNATDNSGRKLESGVYYYRVSVDGYAETKQMVLLK
ncbi:MAG: hypothetical protein SCALA702_19180 [Melioribacteraceae bacterium]|nr:MAG: hypothetical protein SCALA702_19180 [Melioribacteraceae bacterium]